MGNTKKTETKSRRWFLTLGIADTPPKEKVKMLTADGKLVEVYKSVVDAANQQSVSNKDILQWMKNPSKNDE
jgi:hypothetical protein